MLVERRNTVQPIDPTMSAQPAVLDWTAERATRLVGGACGILGAVAVALYFVLPAFLAWPYAGASGRAIVDYANAHSTLFYAGAWLQVTGTLLCVVFFVSIVRLARPTLEVAELLAVVGAAVLLSTVVIEAALLVAVPIAADAGDVGTATSTFALSNGVFVRVFPLAPASLTLVALGIVLLRSTVSRRLTAWTAVGLGAAFELAGLLAIVSSVAVAAAVVLSIAQGLWVLAAAAELLASSRSKHVPDSAV
jgi:hypothetical protein